MSHSLSKVATHTLPSAPFHSALNASGEYILSFASENGLLLQAVHLITGKMQWQKDSKKLSRWHHLAGFAEHQLLIKEFTDKQNPEKIQWWIYDWQSDELSATTIRPDPAPIKVPVTYWADEEHFKTILQFKNEPLVLACEYWEQQDTIILSYYVKKSNRIDRYLQVIQEGATTYLECQDTDLSGFAPNSFFIFKDRLIFIQDHVHLKIYQI